MWSRDKCLFMYHIHVRISNQLTTNYDHSFCSSSRQYRHVWSLLLHSTFCNIDFIFYTLFLLKLFHKLSMYCTIMVYCFHVAIWPTFHMYTHVARPWKHVACKTSQVWHVYWFLLQIALLLENIRNYQENRWSKVG